MNNYTIFPDPTMAKEGILFVNHEEHGRSGHLGHALVEYAPGCILAFYSNDCVTRTMGHNGFGWVEYKRSTDSGKTWSEPKVLEYSMECFKGGKYTICCEHAVVNAQGEIVLTCLKCCAFSNCWEPFFEPEVIISTDYGETWSDPIQISDKPGRVYDLIIYNDAIYCLHESSVYTSRMDDTAYYLYKSIDGGRNFEEISRLPFDVRCDKIDEQTNSTTDICVSNHFYGALVVLPNWDLAAYVYDESDEFNLEYCTSSDGGVTWSEVRKTGFQKRIRNPQICWYNGMYFLHGRSGMKKTLPSCLVLYKSEDGINWDEGVYIGAPTNKDAIGSMAYYSNNLLVHSPDGKVQILIQSSDPYFQARTNIRHWWIQFD